MGDTVFRNFTSSAKHCSAAGSEAFSLFAELLLLLDCVWDTGAGVADKFDIDNCLCALVVCNGLLMVCGIGGADSDA